MVASSTPGLLRRLLPYAVFLTAFSVVMMVLLMATNIRGILKLKMLCQSYLYVIHIVINPKFCQIAEYINLKLLSI